MDTFRKEYTVFMDRAKKQGSRREEGSGGPTQFDYGPPSQRGYLPQSAVVTTMAPPNPIYLTAFAGHLSTKCCQQDAAAIAAGNRFAASPPFYAQGTTTTWFGTTPLEFVNAMVAAAKAVDCKPGQPCPTATPKPSFTPDLQDP